MHYDGGSTRCKIDLAKIITTTKIITAMPKKEKTKKNIIVLADQQGRYIRNLLQDMVGPNNKVTCYSKPGAMLTDVLNGHAKVIKNLTKKYYIIVLASINDNRPVI